MFFDGVVGNPPYQVTVSGDNKNFATPIYHEFIKIAYNKNLTDKASLIHPARFLFNAGDTPKDFNENFLADKHAKIVKYFPKSYAVFPNAKIKGGVAITEFDAEKTFEPIEIFIPFDELKSIHKKVVLDNKNFRPFSEIVYPRAAYRFVKDNLPVGTNAFDKASEIFFENKPADGREYIKILGRAGVQRIYKWIRRDYVRDPNNLAKYKIFISSSNGLGDFGEVLSTPLVDLPLVGATETFTAVGAFDTKIEAESCLKYIKSKFARALLDILKVTQHNPASTWAKVPLQNFTAASDIDWSKSISEIDAQLYRKYNLTAAEIKFIEEKVKEMY